MWAHTQTDRHTETCSLTDTPTHYTHSRQICSTGRLLPVKALQRLRVRGRRPPCVLSRGAGARACRGPGAVWSPGGGNRIAPGRRWKHIAAAEETPLSGVAELAPVGAEHRWLICSYESHIVIKWGVRLSVEWEMVFCTGVERSH